MPAAGFNITPLMVAVDAQCLRAVQALLKAGALANAVAQDGKRRGQAWAVRSYLAQPNGREILLAVFNGGGNPDTRQPDGDPVLMRFVHDRDVADLALMKRLGADLDIRDRGGDPLITKLAMAQDWDMVWAFIELGAQADYEKRPSPRQPLSLALKGDYPARELAAVSVQAESLAVAEGQGTGGAEFGALRPRCRRRRATRIGGPNRTAAGECSFLQRPAQCINGTISTESASWPPSGSS